MTDDELNQLIEAVKQISLNAAEWEKDYVYNRYTNEFRHKNEPEDKTIWVEKWFDLSE